MKHNGKAGNGHETMHFEDVLVDRQAAIRRAIGSKVDGLTRSDRVSDEDQAQASHEEFVNLRLNGLEYQQLRDIQSAIDKLHTGVFGICENCEEPIATKRLKAIPWAKYCIGCQERMGDRVLREREPLTLVRGFGEHAVS